MSKINLDNISVPERLSTIVDNSIRNAKKQSKTNTVLRRATAIAAALVICMISLNFNAFAQSIQQMFVALQDDLYEFDNASRIEAVDNGYYSQPVLDTSAQVVTATSNGYTLTLNSYTIDENQVCFDFTLTGKDLDMYSDYIHISNRKLTITDSSSNKTQEWEDIYDPNTKYSSRIFPGGHFIDDPQNNFYEYVDGDDSSSFTTIKKTGEDTYNLFDIVEFDNPIIVGDEIKIHIGSIFLSQNGDLASDEPEVSKYIDGDWNFTIPVDDKFITTDTLVYEISNPEDALEKGIEIKGLTVYPLTSKLEIGFDSTKNDIVHPSTLDPKYTPEDIDKLKGYDLIRAVTVKCGDDELFIHESKFISNKDGKAYYTLDLDSSYFQNADSLEIIITERNGNTVTENNGAKTILKLEKVK